MHESGPRSHNFIAKFLGVPPETLKLMKKGETEAIPLKFLIKRLDQLKREESWGLLNRILAFTVYGLVLFPLELNGVDSFAIKVFNTVEYEGVNPIPASLADTYLSLSHCQTKGKEN